MSKLKQLLILFVLLALFSAGCVPNPEPAEVIEPDPQEEPSEEVLPPEEEGKEDESGAVRVIDLDSNSK